MNERIKELIEANGLTLHGDIEHFAALVEAAARADEREACAEILLIALNTWLGKSEQGEQHEIEIHPP